MKKPKTTSPSELRKAVQIFNDCYPVGSTCTLVLDSGEKKLVTVKYPASIMGGDSAVGWFEEISGCYMLGRVQK
jgi:hypothetical protein